MMRYGFSVSPSGSMKEVEERVVEALKQEGFGILTEIDVQATLKKKLELDTRPYRILGACNPILAHKALEAEPDIGLLLPCNVVLRENEDGAVVVSFMDPESVLTLVERDDVAALASDVKERLQRVADAVLQD
jgi:uncharacterized protein (DUF302 family)